jgi:hypothetical protein
LTTEPSLARLDEMSPNAALRASSADFLRLLPRRRAFRKTQKSLAKKRASLPFDSGNPESKRASRSERPPTFAAL